LARVCFDVEMAPGGLHVSEVIHARLIIFVGGKKISE
jgi:hypothetical protein